MQVLQYCLLLARCVASTMPQPRRLQSSVNASQRFLGSSYVPSIPSTLPYKAIYLYTRRCLSILISDNVTEVSQCIVTLRVGVGIESRSRLPTHFFRYVCGRMYRLAHGIKYRWQDHIRNSEVAVRTGLGPVSDLITRSRNSVFGHTARLSEDTPAHQALRCRVDVTLGHLPDQSWKRRPGRPNNRWIDQLRRDNNNTPPADLWRRSTTRGHSGVTLRSSTTTR